MTPETRLDPPDRDAKFATPQEARYAIENLLDADHIKLLIIARSFAKIRLKGTVFEPEDLLQDAITKTLDGRRRWNRRVSIIKHLDRVMESDAGHVAEQQVARNVVQLPEGDTELSTPQLSPEARFQIRDELENLLALFAEDEIALKLLRLKRDGFSASEIQQELGIEKKQYETVTKRIRRRIVKYLDKE